ncbi:unnamed protein product [Lathyrus sativus]|nr:unnamed protein product [Lathyrus sativus]
MEFGFKKNSHHQFLLHLLILILVLPTFVLSECTCDQDKQSNISKAYGYRAIAFLSILIAGAFGASIPFLGKVIPALSLDKNIFFIIKAFAAGVILSASFIHVLPDAFESLKSPCLNDHPWGDFPFTCFLALCSAMAILMVETYANIFFMKLTSKEAHVDVNSNTDVEKEVLESYVPFVDKSYQFIRQKMMSPGLEFCIIFHSIIIAISLGASESPNTTKPLMAALCFHQFFEGLGVASCIDQAQGNMRMFFYLTTPVGIGIGVFISNTYDENSPTALIVEGILNATSSGILIYIALVNLLAADFMSERIQKSCKLLLSCHLSLLLGAGCMSLFAKWA